MGFMLPGAAGPEVSLHDFSRYEFGGYGSHRPPRDKRELAPRFL
jgi:hypothetical protein